MALPEDLGRQVFVGSSFDRPKSLDRRFKHISSIAVVVFLMFFASPGTTGLGIKLRTL